MQSGDVCLIICSNCGTTNSDDNGRFCRKCGALLPVSTRPPRIRIKSKESKKIEKKVISPSINTSQTKTTKIKEIGKTSYLIPEAQFFSVRKKNIQQPNQLDLNEIPVKQVKTAKSKKLSINSKVINKNLKKIDLTEILNGKSKKLSEEDSRSLEEITPKPFRGSIIASREVYGTIKHKSEDKIQEGQLSPVTKADSTLVSSKIDDVLHRRKRLEEDMTNILGFLSKKLQVPKTDKPKAKPAEEKLTEKIPPANINEILERLLKLDLHIEASAIIKKEGTILASAVSNRISNSLFATIGMNLSMIGKDIIDGLNAGKLKSISIRGTDGVLDLAPVDTEDPNMKGMILIIFSHPKIKSGIISMAVSIIRKQIIDFLKLKK